MGGPPSATSADIGSIKTMLVYSGSNVYDAAPALISFKALKYIYINLETKGFFQFKIIINVLVSSFRFI